MKNCPAPGAHAGVNERRSRRFKMVGDDKAGRAGGEAASLQEEKRGASYSATFPPPLFFFDNLFLMMVAMREEVSQFYIWASWSADLKKKQQ